MSRVNVCSVKFSNNPAKFTDEFGVEIMFETFEDLPKDLEFKVIYVGSASQDYDQELNTAVIGPTPEGKHKFALKLPAPDPSKIPKEDIVGVSVLLFKIFYAEAEFLNLGWWVSNVYDDEELRENPPAEPQIDKLHRTIKEEDIRVTNYPIKWNDDQVEEQPEPQEDEMFDEADLMPMTEDDEQDDEGAEDEESPEDGEEEGEVVLEDTREQEEEEDIEESIEQKEEEKEHMTVE